MDQVLDILVAYSNYITIGLVGINVLFLLLIIVLFIKSKNLKKKYTSFMKGDNLDIETLLKESLDQLEETKEAYKDVEARLSKMQEQVKNSIQKVGLVEYSALENTGAELSFALALLNETNDGVLLNGIYTREGSYIYGKKLVNAETSKSLTDEETEAIRLAKNINI